SVALSRLGTDVFHPRYLLFSHLHFLVGVGVLLARIPLRVERALLAGVVLAAGRVLSLDFWEQMDVRNKPRLRAAIAAGDAARRPGALVLVGSSLLHSAALYYADDPHGCCLYDFGRPVPHYRGGPVILPEEMINASRLYESKARRVWAINMENGRWG